MSIIVIAGLAVALATASGTAVALAIRQGGLKEKLAELRAQNRSCVKSMEHTAKVLEDEMEKHDASIKLLVDDLREMEDRLAECSDPAVVRAEFKRVLLALSEEASDNDSGG